MPFVRAVETAVPPHRIEQAQARAAYRLIHGDGPRLRLFDRAGVASRCFAKPLEYYLEPRSFARRNRDYVEVGTELAARAARAALERCELAPRDIAHLFFVTTTGLATPSIDALLCQRLGFRPDVMRHPLFGIGCAGGVAGLSRAAALLRGEPGSRALLVSLELCSLTFRRSDDSLTGLVGAALFGDGAAAVVLEGDAVARGGAEIIDTAAELFPGTEGLMGWDFVDDGMRLVMSPDIPSVVREIAVPAMERFRRGRPVDHWIVHPGGPKVLAAYGLSDEELEPARSSLRELGNLSSAAVLFILSRVRPRPGETGLVAAVGPGFGIELAYLQWPARAPWGERP